MGVSSVVSGTSARNSPLRPASAAERARRALRSSHAIEGTVSVMHPNVAVLPQDLGVHHHTPDACRGFPAKRCGAHLPALLPHGPVLHDNLGHGEVARVPGCYPCPDRQRGGRDKAVRL